MATYFISDIHLHAESTHQAKLLLEFLQDKGPTADAIYILGDLFAIWLGDDLNEPYSQELITTLQTLSAQKVPLYFMRGNRDFLVGQKFCSATGCTLLPDPCKISLYGQEILLTHGDRLCTLDQKYQKFRKIVQNPMLKKIFLMLPIKYRKKIGMWIKQKANHMPLDPTVFDAAPHTVAEWLSTHGVKTMIHGHTHLPAMHIEDAQQRIVLGDWTADSAKILVCTPESFALQDLLAH